MKQRQRHTRRWVAAISALVIVVVGAALNWSLLAPAVALPPVAAPEMTVTATAPAATAVVAVQPTPSRRRPAHRINVPPAAPPSPQPTRPVRADVAPPSRHVGLAAGPAATATTTSLPTAEASATTAAPPTAVVVTPPTAAPAATPVSLKAGVPVRLIIPRLGIDTQVEQVGMLADGAMGVPANVWHVAWFNLGTRPGNVGNAVIDGHLDSATGPAVFLWLRNLQQGDRLFVTDDMGVQRTFEVVDRENYGIKNAPLQHIFGSTDQRSLNLITCSGAWDNKDHIYDQRLVVYTRLVV